MNECISKLDFNFLRKEERQRRILEEIKKAKGNIKKKELAEKFAVTERTIVRDIKSIIADGHTIVIKSGRNGGYVKVK